MQHVDTKVILSIDISAIVNEEFTGIRVTLEGGEMERDETISAIFDIDPVSYFIMTICLFSLIQECLEAFDAIVEGTLVQQCLSFLADDFVELNILVALKVTQQCYIIVTLDGCLARLVCISILLGGFSTLDQPLQILLAAISITIL